LKTGVVLNLTAEGYVRRRDFIKVIAGSTAVWPLAARAQQPTTPVVGFLNSLRQSDRPNLQAAFRRGLSEAGYVDGRNVAIEYRFAEGHYDRLPTLAADLIGRKVAVIAATGGGASILAAMAGTKTVPIVFTTGGDPVKQGYVASLNRPGGNVTGVSWFNNLIASKALGLLHELVPNAAVLAMLVNPKLPESARMQSEGHESARALGRQLLVFNASSPSEIDAAFATMRERRAGALLVEADPFLSSRAQQIVALAARCHPGHVLQPRFYRRGRADQLRQRHGRCISPRRSPRGSHSQRCLARRPAGRSGHQIRIRDQPQNRQNAWA
jgi:putative tryptophan/tyrosine transport system substrate-binding protein